MGKTGSTVGDFAEPLMFHINHGEQSWAAQNLRRGRHLPTHTHPSMLRASIWVQVSTDPSWYRLRQ